MDRYMVRLVNQENTRPIRYSRIFGGVGMVVQVATVSRFCFKNKFWQPISKAARRAC